MWLADSAGTLIDFSTGYTFSFKIGDTGAAALLTKTTGITGAAGAGVAPTGTPNIVVAWSAGELNVTPGQYAWELTCTNSSLDRVFYGSFTILDTVT